MDIKKAIEVEKEYLNIKDRKEQAEFNLPKKLNNLEFTFKEFYKEKQKYNFKKAKYKIKETTPEDFFNNDISETIKKDKEIFFYAYNDKDLIFTGKDNDYNKQYCEDNNITILELEYDGGTIISKKGDINFGIVIKQNDMENYFKEIISKALTNLGVNNKFIDNDILIYGNDTAIEKYKICGCGIKQLGDYTIYMFQISFNVDMDLIKNVCNKKMNKVPIGISEVSNIINKDLIKEIKEWLK